MVPLDPAWAEVLSQAWPQLTAKGRICVPRGLPHPKDSGFSQPWVSEPAGQVADWTYSLDDGSRVHAHEYQDGSIVVHRDALDPGQGPIRAVLHLATETTLGRCALLFAVGGAVGFGIAKLGFGFKYVPLTAMLPP